MLVNESNNEKDSGFKSMVDQGDEDGDDDQGDQQP